MPECLGDRQLPQETGDGQAQQRRPVGGLDVHPLRRAQHTAAQRHAEGGPEHQRRTGLAAADHAPDHIRHRVTHCRHQHGQRTDGQKRTLVRPQRDHHASQAHGNRNPVPRLHRFLQHRDRQHGDDQRRHEGQCVGLRQSECLETEGEQGHHHHARHTAQQMQPPAQAPAEDRPHLAPPHDVQAHQRHGGPATQGGHLQRRIGAGQGFEQSVHAGEHGHGSKHRHDAAQISGQRHSFFGLWWSAERVSVRSTDYLVCISWRIAAPGALRLTRRYKLPRKLHHRLFTFCLGRRYITTEQPTGRLCPAF